MCLDIFIIIIYFFFELNISLHRAGMCREQEWPWFHYSVIGRITTLVEVRVDRLARKKNKILSK